MLKVAISVCLLGVAWLVIIGGCTPEADKTWSESDDFSGWQNSDWSGWYSVWSSIDGRFTGITLYQTGSSLQGYDNMRRTWSGTITPGQTPPCNLETSDGPSGTEVLAGNFELIPTLDPEWFYLGCIGQHWASPKTGEFELLGPLVNIPTEE